ncbi:YlbF family regulator [Alkalihalobacillus sp. BA299]|uniref:YlbF family regulator n=1 Tax=Alkalihalobacillus sp. BA299 TaxID=2815938 RepID=UPI001ADC710F|nr:YlbF family regulator [Alkalihalobacillus sp. BA299]
MITSMTSFDILEETHQLSQAILSSDVFNHYIECKYKLQQDKEAQSLINRFVQLKEDYEEVQRFGKYHPNFHETSKRIRELKRELDLYPVISDYKKAESELEGLLYEISTIIASNVSPHIKVPSGNPYFDQIACGGGCGSGGSCGCK